MALAARDISPSVDARSPPTSTTALFFSFTTPTEITGMAVEVPSAFLPMVEELTLMFRFASDWRDTSLPARMLPSFVSFTDAVLVLLAQSAIILKPRSLARFCPIWETFQPFQAVLSKVVTASADTSTLPSDTIWPATSTVAVLVLSTVS